MPTVRAKEHEDFDLLMRRFKRACEKASVLTELRRREYYEKPTEIRKRKAAAAIKRHMKRLSRELPVRARDKKKVEKKKFEKGGRGKGRKRED